jgi:hypothetical protein
VEKLKKSNMKSSSKKLKGKRKVKMWAVVLDIPDTKYKTEITNLKFNNSKLPKNIYPSAIFLVKKEAELAKKHSTLKSFKIKVVPCIITYKI